MSALNGLPQRALEAQIPQCGNMGSMILKMMLLWSFPTKVVPFRLESVLQEWGKIRDASLGRRLGNRPDSSDQRFFSRPLEPCFATLSLAHLARLPLSDWTQAAVGCC